MTRCVVTNARIITPFRILDGGNVYVEDGKIVHVGETDMADARVVDAGGCYLSPGFIDLHVHGGGGADFMDGTPEAFLTVAETHARFGTTALVPTTLTAETEDLLITLDAYAAARRVNTRGAAFLGMHLEGPYFALSQRGAQDPRYIRNPDPAEYQRILDYSPDIIRWSAAPELPGALAFGRCLKERGILAALAHTDAVYDEVVAAVENGYSLATHFYSAMSGVMRRNAFRYAGVIESVYLLDEIDVEVIADGVHLPAPLLKLIYKVKGIDRIALITDAMRAAGMPPGESILGSEKNGLRVIVEDGVAKLPDRTSFAGSVATANRLVRTFRDLAEVPLHEAVRAASLTPARIMGIDTRKGSIAVGKDADLVLFDENIEVKWTMVEGQVVFGAGGMVQGA